MNLHKLLKRAKNEAQKSEHQYKLGAVIFRQGKVIGKGFNKTKRGISNLRGFWTGSVHAEIAALISTRGNADGSSILVVRHNGRCARPCVACFAALKEAGIKRVFYSNNGFIDMEKV